MMHDINLRGGVFCNPGAATKALNLSFEDIKRHHSVYKRKCGDNQDIIEGNPTGALRISFGLCNTVRDVERWITFLKTFFVPDQQLTSNNELGKLVSGRLLNISIYPVKSCGGYSPNSWKIGVSGLSFDRHWMLVDENGSTLTQKLCSKMALIRPGTYKLYSN
jgi:molybdenum cofactor sulfurtransferase